MRRSALYVPADNARAMAKAASLDADVIIFDLEDGIAPQNKATAREAIVSLLRHPRESGDPELLDSRFRGNDTLRLVRINHHSTKHYEGDIAALADAPMNGIMLSKVSSASDIDHALERLAPLGRADLPIWCNVETPLGIENAFSIAAHPAAAGLVAGTNDLANDLRVRRTPDRAGLMHSLQRLLLAARAHGKIALDGTFIDFEDEAGLRKEAEQGRMLGFDGKTLVHPKQIAIANEVFGISEAEKTHARDIINAYETAMREGKAVILLNGKMIERLHYERANTLINATN